MRRPLGRRPQDEAVIDEGTPNPEQLAETGQRLAVPPSWWKFLLRVWGSFGEDRCTASAAALAYATVFALPPLMTLLIWLAGTVVEPEQITASVETQLSQALGEDVAKGIRPFLENANTPGATWWGFIIGVVGTILGALGVFLLLHASLNLTWGVQADPQANGILTTILQRLLALCMVLILVIVMLAGMLLETMTNEATRFLETILPEWMSHNAAYLLQNLATMSLFVLVLTALYKYVPDVRVYFRHALYGAIFAAVLFFIGKFLIAYNVSEAKLNSAYGRAGALVLLMAWVYYSSLIILLGAEFVAVWAEQTGYPLVPERRSVKVTCMVVREDEAEDGESADEHSERDDPAKKYANLETQTVNADRSKPPVM